jgi:hypothetical protein
MSSESKQAKKPTVDPNNYGFKGQLSAIVLAANNDPSPISVLTLGGSRTEPDAAVAIVKGTQATQAFRSWAEEQGLCDPDRSGGMAKAVRTTAEVGAENGTFFVTSPMVCPCPDPKCTASCVEVGCREHPTAGMRAFVFGHEVRLVCNACAKFILVAGASKTRGANRAVFSNDIN